MSLASRTCASCSMTSTLTASCSDYLVRSAMRVVLPSSPCNTSQKDC